jgi:hypothetical protein
MKLILRIASYFFLLFGPMALGASGQSFADARDHAEANRTLDNAPAKSRLPCFFDLESKPYLDFLYRYLAAFEIDCRLGSMIQPGTTWFAVIRITNQFSKPTLMLEEFEIPQVPHGNDPRFYAPISKLKVSMTGGFAMGPGRYLVEIALTDQRGSSIRRRWRLKLPEYKEEEHIPSALLPGAVAPLSDPHWDGALSSRGARVTVLLDVESLFHGARLSAGYRAYLLQSLASLLNQLPCKSVRLIAFSLDTQEELFRQDILDADGFARLDKVLDRVQFDMIPYRALMRGASTRFLVNMIQREITLQQTPDAVIFLGLSGLQPVPKIPLEMLDHMETNDTRVYYLRYLRFGAPDMIENLTRELHGTVIPFDSARTLAHAITTMSTQIGVARPEFDRWTPPPDRNKTN